MDNQVVWISAKPDADVLNHEQASLVAEVIERERFASWLTGFGFGALMGAFWATVVIGVWYWVTR